MLLSGVKDSDDEEEENNTSPVKRPSNMMSGKAPPKVAQPGEVTEKLSLAIQLTCV